MVESDPLTPQQLCEAAVELLIGRYRWQLLSRDEFARRALIYLCNGNAADPTRAAMHAYTLALYMACSGAEGAGRQNLAYVELFQYLHDIARRRYPDACDDATQHALQRTFMAFDRCREPGAFLAFALQHLMDAARAIRRQTSDFPLHTAVPDHQQQSDPVAQALAGELRARFEQLIAEFLRQHPRSAQQIAALRLKFIDGLNDATISRRLGKPIASVHVLRSRAIEKLRDEPEWRAIARELGFLPEK